MLLPPGFQVEIRIPEETVLYLNIIVQFFLDIDEQGQSVSLASIVINSSILF